MKLINIGEMALVGTFAVEHARVLSNYVNFHSLSSFEKLNKLLQKWSERNT